jgi:hypothetical protein
VTIDDLADTLPNGFHDSEVDVVSVDFNTRVAEFTVNAIGIAIGWYLGANVRRYVDMVSNVGTVGAYSHQLDVLRREGTPEAYQEALRATLAFLEKVQQDSDPFLTRSVIRGDQVLILARLARLESRQGRLAESQAYVDRAVRSCLEIPWKRCDAHAVLDLSERMERRAEHGNTDSSAAS